MRTAVVQLDTVWEDKAANYSKVEKLLDGIGERPELICLPEMFGTGFSMDASIQEDPEGPTFRFIRKLAQDRQSFVLGTTVEKGQSAGRNTALLFDPLGNLLSRYAKIHPFSFAGEDQFYEKGDNLPVVSMGGFHTATPICYDLRFPELFRRATHEGATLFIVPANWPLKRVHHWRSLLIARAIENLAYVVAINRAGSANDLDYPGASMIVAPSGEILAEGTTAEEVIVADIDPSAVAIHRDHFRFLADVRTDLFPDLFRTPSRIS